MAKANLKAALGTEKIGKFGGICHGGSRISTRQEKGSFNAFDICNFRILPGGRLEKREGFAPLMTLPAEPRGFWSGYLDGEEMTFALIGSSVYSVDLEGDAVSLLGSVLSSEGRAEFFFYRGVLYLIDGTELYRYDGEDFTAFSGYVPLYGKNWSGSYGEKIHEPINYLSDRIRIHYKLTDAADTFYIGIRCSEILSFKSNGIDYLDKVSLSEDGSFISLSNIDFPAGREVHACLRLDEGIIDRLALVHNTRAMIYGGADDGRILLYGGDNRSDIFVSRYVGRQDFLESVSVDVASTEVYFPVTDVVSVTDGRYPVTALCRHYDRLLIFTERETWMADFTGSATSPYIVPINSSVGCLSEQGAVLGANSPYTVAEGGIYRWTSNDDERNECNAVNISGEIADMLEPSFFDHAVSFYLRERGEVWFADPDSDEQDVWIYSVSGQKWFRFDGIPVDSFFNYRNNVGMIYGRYVFAFSENNTVDTSAEGAVQSNIEAYYESNLTDFGYPERTKHLGRALITADCDGDEFTLTLLGDMGGKRIISVKEDDGSNEKYPTYFDARSGIGRFREMNYIIRTSGMGRPQIRALTLTALK